MPKTKPKKTAPRKKKNLREKINARALIDALEQHVLGENEMTPSQVNAALALLKKTLPDLSVSDPVQKLMREEEAKTAHEDALALLE